MQNLVSIIMPSYNTAQYIEESIQSVINQSYRDWELIIVDDNSTDDTDIVIKKYENDNRIIYIKNEENLGAALTRNKAIRAAKGKYIAFLDSDDLWTSDKLSKQINFMQENNYVFTYHNFEKIDEDSNPLNVLVTGPKVVTKRKMYNYGYPGCLTFIYDAEFYGLIQIEDIKKNNDYAILLQLCKKANCYLLDETLAKYRIRKQSISHDKLYKKLKSHFDLFHVCDKQNAVKSFYLATKNMVYGIDKKLRYEKRK